jgi:hypothetical protein
MDLAKEQLLKTNIVCPLTKAAQITLHPSLASRARCRIQGRLPASITIDSLAPPFSMRLPAVLVFTSWTGYSYSPTKVESWKE